MQTFIRNTFLEVDYMRKFTRNGILTGMEYLDKSPFK